MTGQELLTGLRAALEAERTAIRKLDVEAVTEAAATKERLLQGLLEASPAERPALVIELTKLKGELRQNLLLLAHARDFLRDAVELCRPNGKARITAKL